MECQAFTKSGKQCSQKAEPNSKFCWQHQNYEEKKTNIPKTTTIKSPKVISPKNSPRNRSIIPNNDIYYVVKLYYKKREFLVNAFSSLDKLLNNIDVELKELADNETLSFQDQLNREGLGHLESQYQSNIYSDYLILNNLPEKLNYYLRVSYDKNTLNDTGARAVAIFKGGNIYVTHNYSMDGQYIKPPTPTTIMYPLTAVVTTTENGYYNQHNIYIIKNEKELKGALQIVYGKDIKFNGSVDDLFQIHDELNISQQRIISDIVVYFTNSTPIALIKYEEESDIRYLNINDIPYKQRKIANFKSSPRNISPRNLGFM